MKSGEILSSASSVRLLESYRRRLCNSVGCSVLRYFEIRGNTVCNALDFTPLKKIVLISDQFRFAFVHIPKCAGTSLRSALSGWDDRKNRYYERGISEHPELGMVDFHHLPLQAVKDYFPRDFDCIRNYWSFAVLRDPIERFPSSLAQHALMYHGSQIDSLSDEDGRRMLDDVLDRLSKHGRTQPISAPELIHFARQTDYTHMHGEQIVQQLYPLARLGELVGELEQRIGQSIELETRNQRVRVKSRALNRVSQVTQASLSRILPDQTWIKFSHFVRDGLMAAGVVEKLSASRPAYLDLEEVETFLRDFYAKDIAVYEFLS